MDVVSKSPIFSTISNRQYHGVHQMVAEAKIQTKRNLLLRERRSYSILLHSFILVLLLNFILNWKHLLRIPTILPMNCESFALPTLIYHRVASVFFTLYNSFYRPIRGQYKTFRQKRKHKIQPSAFSPRVPSSQKTEPYTRVSCLFCLDWKNPDFRFQAAVVPSALPLSTPRYALHLQM